MMGWKSRLGRLEHACRGLTLVIAGIIYWQAKEIHRVIQTHDWPTHIDLDRLSQISPVSWENIILYGDDILNRNQVAISSRVFSLQCAQYPKNGVIRPV